MVCGRPKLVTRAFHAALYMTPEYPRPAIAALALPLTSVFLNDSFLHCHQLAHYGW